MHKIVTLMLSHCKLRSSEILKKKKKKLTHEGGKGGHFQLYISRAPVICVYVKISSTNNNCEYLRNTTFFYTYTYIHYFACDDVNAKREYMAFLSQRDLHLN